MQRPSHSGTDSSMCSDFPGGGLAHSSAGQKGRWQGRLHRPALERRAAGRAQIAWQGSRPRLQAGTEYFQGLTDARTAADTSWYLTSPGSGCTTWKRRGTDRIRAERLHKARSAVRIYCRISGPAFKEQDPVNIKAAELMGKLHDALKAAGYDGHALEVLLVRLLFCLFADDTGIFPAGTHSMSCSRSARGRRPTWRNGWPSSSRCSNRTGARRRWTTS